MKPADIISLYEKFKASKGICTDTRKLEKDQVFFALKGGNFNGNKFAEQAINDGASFAVIDEAEYKKDERFIVVEDVLDTFQTLANYHRRQFKIPFIAITGSNGKTTTKELVNAVLSTTFKTIATKGNLNNHIGVPITLLSIPEDTEMAVIEMGANAPIEINQLCKYALPNFGLITNIGKAHLEGFGGIEGVAKAKGELFEFLESFGGRCFVNMNDDRVANQAYFIQKATPYGSNKFYKTFGEIVETDSPYLTVKWQPKTKDKKAPPLPSVTIETKLTGAYNLDNILAAIAVGSHFKISAEKIKNAIENYIPQNQRSQIIEAENHTIILDAYNANPTSMAAALDNFKAVQANKKMAILGDMLEMGEYSEAEHQQIVSQLKNMRLDKTWLVGSEFAKSTIPQSFQHFNSVEEAKLAWQNLDKQGYHCLIKASRSIGLEKLIK